MNLLVLVSAVFLSAGMGEDPKYPVSAIPEESKAGMYAVIREQEEKFEINAANSSTHYYRIVITILNSNGKNFAHHVAGYDKFTTLESFKAIAYDEQGKVIKKLKQNEIIDRSAYDGSSLFSDNRIKIADVSQATYPYTVEFEYTEQNKFLFYIPSFHLYDDDEVFIQKTKYSLVFPEGQKPRYKLFNIKDPVITKEGNKGAFVWSFENIRPNKFESMSAGTNKTVPHILAGPTDFEFDGYKGRLDTWSNYGKWQTSLNEGRGTLPEATVLKIKQLTKDANSVEEKSRILYKYMQEKTRYVGVQLGIGGWQPFEAKVVDQTGYGDCKALSNYMIALLKEAGVKGYYTKIRAGKDSEDMDVLFPSTQSNHVIVSVPNGADTIWLECTSQTNPFGYMGTFTGNRHALMVTESGGKIVRTPSYGIDQNLQSTSADITISLTGDAKAKVKTIYSGLQYENNGLDFVVNQSYDDQKKWVQNNTQIPVFDVATFSMQNQKDKVPSAIVNVELGLKKYASVSGKRIFLTPNMMNKSTFVPEKLESRRTDIERRMAYTDIDSMHYHLPEGIYPEFLPEPIRINSRFGEYETQFKLDGNGLIYIRKIKIKSGEFPAASYNELIDFYKSINKADNTKIVFLSKT